MALTMMMIFFRFSSLRPHQFPMIGGEDGVDNDNDFSGFVYFFNFSTQDNISRLYSTSM